VINFTKFAAKFDAYLDKKYYVKCAGDKWLGFFGRLLAITGKWVR